MDRVATARAYYEALDAADYDDLADLLAPDFRQERPDRTFDGRDAFVAFMRDERPRTDTRHPIDAVYERDDGPSGTADGAGTGDGAAAGTDGAPTAPGDVAVEGRLVTEDGERIAAFVDVFAFADDRISRLWTYTR